MDYVEILIECGYPADDAWQIVDDFMPDEDALRAFVEECLSLVDRV